MVECLLVSKWCGLGLTIWKALPAEGFPIPMEEAEGGEERGGTRGINPPPPSVWEEEPNEASTGRLDHKNPPR